MMDKVRLLFLLVIGLVAGSLSATAQVKLPERPDPPRLVNDFAGVLGNTRELEDTLRAFSKSTSNQILVVTVKDLQGLEP